MTAMIEVQGGSGRSLFGAHSVAVHPETTLDAGKDRRPVEEMIPRSAHISVLIFREVEVLVKWLIDHPKRKTVPIEVVESHIRRVTGIIPYETQQIMFAEETLMSLNSNEELPF